MNNSIIRRTPVRSSCIASIGYADQVMTLEVEFRSGAVYRYFMVPRLLHTALLAAPSKGTFLNQRIRGHFPEAQWKEIRNRKVGRRS
jgi:hypothetical protein